MDYELEKTITINRDTKHKSLYEWCLNEIGTDGKLQSRDLIPFRWSLHFTGTSLKVLTSVNITRNGKTDEIKSVKTTSIYGKFYSGICRDGENLSDDVKFSIFGTDRIVKEFDVTISVKTDDMEEACWLIVIPSYESEGANFIKYLEDDFIGFQINLNKDKFNELVNLIENRAIDSVNLITSEVSGVYSDWSPSFTTRSVKVLTARNVIEGADVENFEGTTASLIGDFNINFATQVPLNVKSNLPSVDFENQFNEDSYKIQPQSNSSSPAASKNSQQVLTDLVGKVKLALWCIFAALVVIILK